MTRLRGTILPGTRRLLYAPEPGPEPGLGPGLEPRGASEVVRRVDAISAATATYSQLTSDSASVSWVSTLCWYHLGG